MFYFIEIFLICAIFLILFIERINFCKKQTFMLHRG